jgi:hypothetical protein
MEKEARATLAELGPGSKIAREGGATGITWLDSGKDGPSACSFG